ncbi:MAG: MOSC domain-containing protein [Clostridiales bacterium]|nr:MOSC domain-containing protein [Clostridiales bacterium]
MSGIVLSINSSEQRGTNKYPIEEGYFKEGFGLEGDGHGGDWHRQVSVFDVSSLDRISDDERKICESTYSENITSKGMIIHTLPIGTRLEIGEAIFEVTQIGKPFERNPSTHTPREVIMHDEGVFVIVIKSGYVRVGDMVSLVAES